MCGVHFTEAGKLQIKPILNHFCSLTVVYVSQNTSCTINIYFKIYILLKSYVKRIHQFLKTILNQK